MTFVPITEVQKPNSSNNRKDRSQRLPDWFKVKLRQGPDYREIRRIIDERGLHTICEEARCPNMWECWNNRTATFLILGDICTRRCHYCSVETGKPVSLDLDEPQRVAEAIEALDLRHAVITSVNRDELQDGGASVFAETIRLIREKIPTCSIEVLIPDFQGNEASLKTVLGEKPDILNHNIETVPRLFPAIRPQGKYNRSIQLLKQAKQLGTTTKSGLIAGLGESIEEIRQVMRDLRSVGCDIVTIGQYLQPTRTHIPVARFYTPEEFELLKNEAQTLGFKHVESGPLVRSSYHAEQQTVNATI